MLLVVKICCIWLSFSFALPPFYWYFHLSHLGECVFLCPLTRDETAAGMFSNIGPFLRELALQVSNEEELNDPFLVQSKVLKTVEKNFPFLLERGVLHLLNDTKEILQRYTLGVIIGSMSNWFIVTEDVSSGTQPYIVHSC